MILIAKPGPIIQGSLWMSRGGCWGCVGRNYRSSYRIGYRPTLRYNDMGFRVALRKKKEK